MTLLLLTVACASHQPDGKEESNDSDLDHTGEDTGGDTSHPDTDTDPVTDTATKEEACTLEVAPARAWVGAPTCADVDFQGFDLLLEREFEGIVYSEPIAMPLSDGVTRVVANSSWVNLSLIDVAAGSETLFEGVQIGSQGVGAGRPQDGSPVLLGIGQQDATRDYLSVLDETGRLVGISGNLSYIWGPSVADVDFEGVPDFVSDGVVVDRNATSRFETPTTDYAEFATVYRQGDGGSVVVLGSPGIWYPKEGVIHAWDGLPPLADGFQDIAAARFVLEGEEVIFGRTSNGLFEADDRGVVQWSTVYADNAWDWDVTLAAWGDVTGDGEPDACVGMGTTIGVIDLVDREVLWDAPNTDGGLISTGGCAMADLDADGRYEVIQYGALGLFVRDGATGEALASREDIGTDWWNMAAIVADVDADGSAEIVVSGGYQEDGLFDHQDHLFVFGAAQGRWARTRPVWNQMAYDVTSIRDDGIINSFPFNNWDTYNSFRAQPAHDGEHPDLVVAGTDACADTCSAGGTIRLAVQVSNPGSVDAFAGSIVRLYTWTEATGLRVVAETTLEDTVPAGESAEAVVLEVPYEDWGDQRMLEVVGTHDDECDWVNNREEIAIPDPCSEAR